jgi:hypothetical protein
VVGAGPASLAKAIVTIVGKARGDEEAVRVKGAGHVRRDRLPRH